MDVLRTTVNQQQLTPDGALFTATIPPNPKRVSIIIGTNPASAFTIAFGGQASATYGLALPSNKGYIELDYRAIGSLVQEAISVYTGSASTFVNYVESQAAQ